MRVTVKCANCGKEFEGPESEVNVLLRECAKHETECESSSMEQAKKNCGFRIADCCLTCRHSTVAYDGMWCDMITTQNDEGEDIAFADVGENNICDYFEKNTNKEEE